MATILLTWELGGGLGHLMNLRPIGQELVRRGHRVIAAVRDLTDIHEIYQGTGIAFIPAPNVRRGPPTTDTIQCFAHLLAGVGFCDPRVLHTHFASWNAIFDLAKPELVIADHAPSVLFALRGRNIPCVNIGLGFFAPPEGQHLPHWGPRGDSTLTLKLQRDEAELLRLMNELLETHKRPQMANCTQLYTQIADTVLATYHEFDHFAQIRKFKNVRYWGHWPFGVGDKPIWPNGYGPKIYAYLKPFPAIEALLTHLKQLGTPTLVVARGLENGLLEKYACPTLRFENHPLDLQQMAAECDLAIHNANHGTAATLLLAGKPCLLIPQFTEQLMFAKRVEFLGAGIVVPSKAPEAIVSGLNKMLKTAGYRLAAQSFQSRYKDFVPGQQVPRLIDHLESFISKPGPRFFFK